LSSAPPPDTPADRGDRRPIITFMIAAASLLFLVAAAVLYYRWISMSEPRCVVVVEASPAWKDAEITVDGGLLMKPLKATIGKEGRYAIPFYLDAGEYKVTVRVGGEAKHHGTVIVSEQMRGWRLELSKLNPTTMPTIHISDTP
jgi:hypothetical protein